MLNYRPFNESHLRDVESKIKSINGVHYSQVDHFDNESHGWAALDPDQADEAVKDILNLLRPVIKVVKRHELGRVGEINQYSNETIESLVQDEADEALSDPDQYVIFYWFLK